MFVFSWNGSIMFNQDENAYHIKSAGYSSFYVYFHETNHKGNENVLTPYTYIHIYKTFVKRLGK